MKRLLIVAAALGAAALGLVAVRHGTGAAAGADASGPKPPAQQQASGIHKIEHVVVIMQENRSFDSYFGTYPGADGIPMRAGVPTVCVPDPVSIFA